MEKEASGMKAMDAFKKTIAVIIAEIFFFSQVSWCQTILEEHLDVPALSGVNSEFNPIDFGLRLTSSSVQAPISNVEFVLEQLETSNLNEIPDWVRSEQAREIIIADSESDLSEMIIFFGEQDTDQYLIGFFNAATNSLEISAVVSQGTVSNFRSDISDFDDVLSVNNIDNAQVITRIHNLRDDVVLFTYLVGEGENAREIPLITREFLSASLVAELEEVNSILNDLDNNSDRLAGILEQVFTEYETVLRGISGDLDSKTLREVSARYLEAKVNLLQSRRETLGGSLEIFICKPEDLSREDKIRIIDSAVKDTENYDPSLLGIYRILIDSDFKEHAYSISEGEFEGNQGDLEKVISGIEVILDCLFKLSRNEEFGQLVWDEILVV